MSLIQDVPVAKYHSVTEEYDHSHALRALLEAYRQQLVELADFTKAKGEPVPELIIRGIRHLNKVLGFEHWHWVAPVQRDEDGTSADGQDNDRHRSVEFMYQELIILAGGDRPKADSLIDLERRNFPKENLRQLIERAIDRLLHEPR